MDRAESWITTEKPALVLAPMEGVTDAPMRALLTELGDFTFCVSEFLRISQDVPPPRTYLEHVPELKQGCETPAGVPIQVQLLGGNEERLAIAAARACALGARAIDLNFGCPAPTVNRHDGGASLLRHPARIRSIVAAVRAAVPRELPVSAKLRLGWESMEDIFVNAEQAELGGAAWITIHARTKFQGYAPPAHWQYIGEVRKRLGIPVVANGEIWTIEDFKRCRDITGCIHYMIGRGALGDPALQHQIARELGIAQPQSERTAAIYGQDPTQWLGIVLRFAEITRATDAAGEQYTARRIKQWMRFANTRSPLPWFDVLKRGQSLQEVLAVLCSPA